MLTYVIPCGGAKRDHAAPAHDLYVGQMFRHTLASALAIAAADVAAGVGPARVLILSARHGLVTLDTVLAPYEQRIDQPGAITVDELADQALALGIDWGQDEVYTLLPTAYRQLLDQALRRHDVYLQDVYEATGGIGDQRHVNAVIAR